jgi:hypothetical protein
MAFKNIHIMRMAKDQRQRLSELPMLGENPFDGESLIQFINETQPHENVVIARSTTTIFVSTELLIGLRKW